jgi:hypothetical protein
MGRIPDSELENSRFLPPPDLLFPKGLDDDIRDRGGNRTTPRIPHIVCTADSIPTMEVDDPYATYPPLTSHVLLTACQHDELAYEARLSSDDHYGGTFTTLLLKLLRQPGRDLAETTYIGLFHTLEQRENRLQLKKQTPYVEGDNRTRILFSMTDPGRHFPVLLQEDGTFSVPAGSIHGVDAETEFTITNGKECFQGLKPSEVSPLECSFSKLDNVTLQDDSRAEVTKWSRLHPKVFLQQPSQDGPSDSKEYDFVISQSSNGKRNLERRDGLIPCYAEAVIPFHSKDAATDLVIIDAISRFNFHLHNSSGSNTIGEKLSIRLERLLPLPHVRAPGTVYRPVENGEDFLASGTLRQQPSVKNAHKVTSAVELPDLSHYFSFTLSVRDVETPLFPYVFAFDPATYQIAVRGFRRWFKIRTHSNHIFRSFIIPSPQKMDHSGAIKQ